MSKNNSVHSQLIKKKLPTHVGIIMDGNGRWAQKKNLSRSKGHLEGLSAAKRVVKAAADINLQYLSLYTFSTENWKRAENEVKYLMFLIKSYLKQEYKFYKKNRIRVFHSGDLKQLPPDVIKTIQLVMDKTKTFNGLRLNLAINYGGRDEIIRSVERWLNKTKHSTTITEDDISDNLDRPEFPAADLIIRTGGDKRISNFLLWESAYAELYFSEKLWPDWQEADFLVALNDYQQRQRRFGGVV
ncbi:MAG: di-trans,poly-cis-decaprenylcistransferase [Spirochaetales bacterium]|nr:di-trans,poly-cis-decaprenylcistransferase [Spirochaetales bacterium]